MFSVHRLVVAWLSRSGACLTTSDHALKDAREIGQAATLMYALGYALRLSPIFCGHYTAADAQLGELATLADEKGSLFWKSHCMSLLQGCVLALTGDPSGRSSHDNLRDHCVAINGSDSLLWLPFYLSYLARAYAELHQFDDAWRCIGEAETAVETTKERWCEAEVNRIAGEIAFTSPEPDAAKAEAYFERALSVARQQQAKSWELRAAMSLARLWRDQGKVQQARELLAPVYGWFTEGFDTRDLKEAKALLEELASITVC